MCTHKCPINDHYKDKQFSTEHTMDISTLVLPLVIRSFPGNPRIDAFKRNYIYSNIFLDDNDNLGKKKSSR